MASKHNISRPASGQRSNMGSSRGKGAGTPSASRRGMPQGASEKERTPITSIKMKLFVGFAIPLVFVIVVGVVSYMLASSGMTTNYEDSMAKAMQMATEYMDFGFSSAVSISEQLYYDDDLVRWATGSIYNDYTADEIHDSVTNDLKLKAEGNEFLEGIYIIPESKMTVIATHELTSVIPGFYDELETAADESACLESLQGGWTGTHSYIDETIPQYEDSYSADNYICSFIRPMTTRRACIAIDYSTDAMVDVLNSLDLGDGSMAAFVTADGRELLVSGGVQVTDSDFSFLDQSYYTEAMESDAAITLQYVSWKNTQYLFIISRSHENGSAICAMVPTSLVTAQAHSISRITIILVIIAIVIAVLLGIYITFGIASTIGHINSKLTQVSGGDLTVSMNTERHDEFKGLVGGIVEMIRHTRDLILQVLNTTENVSNSTEKLSEASETLNSASEQISGAVAEIDREMVSQASDSQNCLVQMDALSDRINKAVDAARRMNEITVNVKNVIKDGMSTMDDLANKSTDTTEITKSVIDNIGQLGSSFAEVEKFVAMINGIAEETSLLALNASIEAARAGEAGKGFAVVAQSVSSLSDNTIGTAKQIQDVMEVIGKNTENTVAVAARAEEIVSKQSETVNYTIQVFAKMGELLEGLISEISSLEETVGSMEQHRNDTLNAIENISAASEETASSVSVVNESLKNQMAIIDNLHDSTLELEQRARELIDAVNSFKI